MNSVWDRLKRSSSGLRRSTKRSEREKLIFLFKVPYHSLFSIVEPVSQSQIESAENLLSVLNDKVGEWSTQIGELKQSLLMADGDAMLAAGELRGIVR